MLIEQTPRRRSRWVPVWAQQKAETLRCQGHTTVICNEFWVANCAMVLLGRDDFFKLFDVMFDWSAPTPYVDIESAGTMRARAGAAAAAT